MLICGYVHRIFLLCTSNDVCQLNFIYAEKLKNWWHLSEEKLQKYISLHNILLIILFHINTYKHCKNTC